MTVRDAQINRDQSSSLLMHPTASRYCILGSPNGRFMAHFKLWPALADLRCAPGFEPRSIIWDRWRWPCADCAEKLSYSAATIRSHWYRHTCGNSPGIFGARISLDGRWRLWADSPGSFALVGRCIRPRVQVGNAVVVLGFGRMQCIRRVHDDRD